MVEGKLDEIRISRARIVQSTVYPDLKSIRPLLGSAQHPKGHAIRRIFDPFSIGATVAIVSLADLNYLMAATRTWEEEQKSAKDQVH